PPSLGEIAGVFARVGIASFGGGLVGWVYAETVTRRRWVSDQEFLSSLALSQVMPGANMVNLAICLGTTWRGYRGALVAGLSLVGLPFLAIIALYEAYGRLAAWGSASFILDGVAAAAVGLNIATGASSLRRSGTLPAVAIALCVFVTVGMLRWP